MDTVQEKIMKKVFVSGDCWVWMGTINKSGQPHVSIDGHAYSPHKYLYELMKQKLSVRYLDSSCGNIRCINPEHRKPRNIENRLLSNIEVDQNTGCWNWTGNTFGGEGGSGYGRMTIDGKNAVAHRVSYQHFKGDIPEGLFICHSCDNRLCINPDHLNPGTHTENMNDMVRAGHSSRGERNGQALLTKEDVVEIKKLISSNKVTYRRIGKMFGVSRYAIKDIASGRTWAWVDDQ